MGDSYLRDGRMTSEEVTLLLDAGMAEGPPPLGLEEGGAPDR